MTRDGRGVVWWMGGAVFVFLYLPLVVLFVLSFNDSKLSVRWQGWTMKWYVQLFQDTPLWDSLWVSLTVAGWSTLLATLVGVAAAIGLERRPHRGAEAVMMVPLVMPELILGVAFMLCFAWLHVPLGRLTVTLAHAAFNAPLVMMLVRARLRKLPPALEEAALDLGATPWQAFRHVTLPLLGPAMVGAALLSCAVSLDDFLVTFFTTGPGATTLPLRVYSNIRAGVTPELNALASLMVVASMVVVAAALWLQRTREA